MKLPNIHKLLEGREKLEDIYIKLKMNNGTDMVIESIGPCFNGLDALSIAFYSELNGDLMRDPELCFYRIGLDDYIPYYYRNDWFNAEYDYSLNAAPSLVFELCEKIDQDFPGNIDLNPAIIHATSEAL